MKSWGGVERGLEEGRLWALFLVGWLHRYLLDDESLNCVKLDCLHFAARESYFTIERKRKLCCLWLQERSPGAGVEAGRPERRLPQPPGMRGCGLPCGGDYGTERSRGM